MLEESESEDQTLALKNTSEDYAFDGERDSEENGMWCIGKDFNAIKKEGEMKGISSMVNSSERTEFNEFIYYLGVKEAIKELNALDFEVANTSVLNGDEMDRKRSLENNKVCHSNFEKESILRQKAKKKWLVEGDSDSKLFHKAMNQSFRRNIVLEIYSVNGWVEKVDDVKREVKSHFEAIFQDLVYRIPSLDGFVFHSLNDVDRILLESPFSMEDLKGIIIGMVIETKF
ncbi:hypothetical protein KIW84_034243 [Lathyrus oleraceus]|uniref:RNA-directed DNA polymerase, eukaryota, reverse transcriptase zinc-binding domain protein n=1 Tax=Pisum sativum TaxID=3888 RepID=A0A9D4XZ16_PEA|nr:hypothetical protein KIW84_034243 [Pisum sativum]